MSPIFFDSKEVRSSDERENDHLVSLKKLIENLCEKNYLKYLKN